MAAQRIVSLCPSITETLVAIGGLKRLVGATRYCVRPEGLLWGLPRIGGTKDPRIAQIVDLRPDLVFANEEENRIEDVRAIEKAGIPVDVSFPRSVADVPPAIRAWGKRLGNTDEATALSARIEESLSEIQEGPPPAPFLYACWIWKDPWMAVSDDTYAADLLRLAGGVNVYGRESDRYPVSTPGESRERGADVHLFPSEPFPFRPDRHAAEMERLFGTEKVRLFIDGQNLTWHGARTLDGLALVRTLRREIAAG